MRVTTPPEEAREVSSRLRAQTDFLKNKIKSSLLSDSYEDLERYATLLCASSEAATALTAGDSHSFWISNLLLEEAFVACTKDRDEGIVVLSGFRVGKVAIPTRVHVPKHSFRSVVGAKADPKSVHQLIVSGYATDHHVLVVMHSHPGCGRGANRPSGEDMATQRLWEETGDVISGIWSRDGWVRFLGHQLDFGVDVVGKGVVCHAPHEYKLDVQAR